MTSMLQIAIALVDKVTTRIGRGASLLLPLLMLVIILNVTLRYGFSLGLVELEELQWHINAIAVLGCLGFAYLDDTHVRVDIWYAGFSTRTKAFVEILGGVFFLLPFTIGIGWFAWDSFVYSFSIREGSPMPSGLPARYIIKFAFVAGLFLLGMQGISRIVQGIKILRIGRKSEAGQ